MSALLAADGGLLAHLNDWDTAVFLLLNGLHSPAWDAIMRQVSSPWVLVPAHLLVVVEILRRPGWRERGWLLALVLLIILCDLAGAHLIKDLVQRPRPPQQEGLASLVHLLGGRRSGTYGFVSTHTAYAFALAAFAWGQLRRPRIALLLLGWAAAVGYSRIYIGLHFPGDVLGGAVWGMTVAAGVWWASARVRPMAHPRAPQPAARDAATDARTPQALAAAATTT